MVPLHALKGSASIITVLCVPEKMYYVDHHMSALLLLFLRCLLMLSDLLLQLFIQFAKRYVRYLLV